MSPGPTFLHTPPPLRGLAALADRKTLLVTLSRLAEEASRIILEVYGTRFLVEEKAPQDLVTLADKLANTFLVEGLAAAYPGIPVVAEESLPETYEGFHTAPACFFVDPLDGTAEFVDRNGEFVVMIGLAEHGRPVAGVVMAPVTGLVYRGAVGAGAELLRPDGGAEPVFVSPRKNVELTGARFVASHRRRTPRLAMFLESVPEADVRGLGSAGLKAMAVATGSADAFVHLGIAGKLWDGCAPEAIVTAAGGVVSDSLGRPLRYDVPDLVLASGVVMATPALHAPIVDALVGIEDPA